GRDSDSVAVASSGRGIESAFSVALCVRYAARGAFFILWRSGAWLQRQSDSYRPHVQHGFDSNDLFWLYLLSLERAGTFPHPPESRTGESPGLRQRGLAWNARAPVPAPSGAGGADSVDSF